jgi:CPA2 family monovalent cation:H+ antiporter-2
VWDQFAEQLLIILTTGLAASLLCRWLDLPPLIGYLTVGALLGDGALGWLHAESEQVARIAELGVFFLLFSIGLELSLDDLRRLAGTMLQGGLLQMGLVALPVVGVLFSGGWPWTIATLIALALSFSSTVLVFKALGELGLTGSTTGRGAVAILLFQDAALIPLLLCVPLLTGAGAGIGWRDWITLILVSVAFLMGVLLLRQALLRWLVPRVTQHRRLDLVLLLTLVVLGLVTFAAKRVGLPPAVGAFAAGVAFGGSRWSGQIDALILPFREAFAAVFFVSLGLLMDFTAFWQHPLSTFLAWLLLIAWKSVASAVALRLVGIPWPAACGAGLGLAHVGEFAFVILLSATAAGAITAEQSGFLLTLAGGTLVVSPLLIRWGFCQTSPHGDRSPGSMRIPSWEGPQRHAIVIGLGPVGAAVANRLEAAGYHVCVIDLRPLNLQPFALQGFRTLTGDAETDEILEAADVAHASLAIVSVPVDEVAERITRRLRTKHPALTLLVRCRFAINQQRIRRAGANAVIAEESQATLELLRLLELHERSHESNPVPGQVPAS